MGGSSGGTLRAGVVFPAAAPELARSWMSGVHELARLSGARVAGTAEPPVVGRSFHRVPLVHGEEMTTLMLNTAALLVACVEGDRPYVENARYATVRHPEVFTRLGLLIADPVAMEQPCGEADLVALSDEEAAQVRYHRPRRIGDIIFNWFD